ncbi:MAG: hypothetical protein AABX34_03700, partial [Nanoarchaeota archaeon]
MIFSKFSIVIRGKINVTGKGYEGGTGTRSIYNADYNGYAGNGNPGSGPGGGLGGVVATPPPRIGTIPRAFGGGGAGYGGKGGEGTYSSDINSPDYR